MTLRSFLQSLARRWYLVVGGILLTACLCGVVYEVTPPGYQRNASILLIPGTSSIPAGGNPYLYLGGLGPASDVIVRSLEAEAATDPVLAAYPDAAITIGRDATTSGPLITMMVEAADDAEAAAVHERLLKLMPLTLSALQSEANVPEEARISSLPLTVDTKSEVIYENRIEATGATAAAGVALTVLVVGLVDGLLLAPPRERSNRVFGSSRPGEGRTGVRDRPASFPPAPIPTSSRVTRPSAGRER